MKKNIEAMKNIEIMKRITAVTPKSEES